jgi:hypothetical protein
MPNCSSCDFTITYFGFPSFKFLRLGHSANSPGDLVYCHFDWQWEKWVQIYAWSASGLQMLLTSRRREESGLLASVTSMKREC